MPLSSPTALASAAAASTQQIGLGTTVTVLSTDEPVRVFQQLATAAAIAPGRIEAVAGRGSSPVTFPIFDLDERDYDMLYGSKLELLLAINGHERVTWSGPHRRRALHNALIVPRPEKPLKIWLGTGGRPAPAPSGRAADYEPGAMVFAGGPNQVADRILHLHQLLGHTRQILQMDVCGMPHATFLKGIELLGTEVLPQIGKELA